MDDLLRILTEAGIAPRELSRAFSTDKGDVLSLRCGGGDEAIATWRQLRALTARTGMWPVMLGPSGEASESIDARREETIDVSATLSAAADIDAAAWFDEKRAERVADLVHDNPNVDPEDLLAADGDWPDEAEPSTLFSTPFELGTQTPHDDVVIALVPPTPPWQVPAFLEFGGWNECPDSGEQCAVMRYWHEQYGAEILAAGRDVIEMHVARPPADQAAALRLARQQYAYCEDIVDQGTQTLAVLAAGLLDGTAWFFWWD